MMAPAKREIVTRKMMMSFKHDDVYRNNENVQKKLDKPLYYALDKKKTNKKSSPILYLYRIVLDYYIVWLLRPFDQWAGGKGGGM